MSSPPQDPEPSGLSKGAQIAVGACLAVALLAWYGYTSLSGEAFTYYQTLEEFQAARPDPDQGLRVHGYVAEQSIERDLPKRQVRFRVQNDPPHAGPSSGDQARLTVVYKSLETPDLFKDGAEVVVEGRLAGDGAETIFVADNVMAKCPSKFQAEAGGEGPAAAGRAEAL